MSIKLSFAAASLTLFAAATPAAFADDHPYKEGPVVNVSRIRTIDGHFDEYMDWVSTYWKKQEEAAKKTGDVLSYEVLAVEPRGPDDPDIYLVITFKNWATLDGSIAKADAIAKQLDGSVAAANKGEADRSKMRRVLGSETMQVLELK